MIEGQTKQPWIAKSAVPNASYGDWIATVKSGTYSIASVKGKTEKICNANATACMIGGNGDVLFPSSFWTEKKDRKVLTNSAELVADLVRQTQTPYKPLWVNTTEYSTTIFFVDSSTPRFPVWVIDKNGKVLSSTKLYKQFQLGVPMPYNFMPSAGKDAHAVIIDREKGPQWEVYGLKFVDGRWQCKWGAYHPDIYSFKGYFDFVSGEKWGGSATSTSLAGGTMRLSDLAKLHIPYLIRFACPDPGKTFIQPALRMDGNVSGNKGIIPYGQIFRLKAGYVTPPTATPFEKMVNRCLQEFGMILTDRSHESIVLSVEDWTPCGLKNALTPYLGGKAGWDVYRKIPLSQLEAVGL